MVLQLFSYPLLSILLATISNIIFILLLDTKRPEAPVIAPEYPSSTSLGSPKFTCTLPVERFLPTEDFYRRLLVLDSPKHLNLQKDLN